MLSIFSTSLICIASIFLLHQTNAQRLPLKGPDDQPCYYHNYTEITNDGENSTSIEFSCEDINYFAAETQTEIEEATNTIKDLTYGETYADVTLVINKADFKVRFVVCGCALPEGSEEKDAYFYTNPTDILVGDVPSIGFLTELALNYTPISFIDTLGNKYDEGLRSRKDEIGQILLDSGEYEWGNVTDKVSVAIVPGASLETHKEQAKAADFGGRFLPVSASEEQHPLARAEWVKVFGLLFFHRGGYVEQVFEDIKTKYNELKTKAAEATRIPTVVLNYPEENEDDDTISWTQPGSDDYDGRFMQDAYGNHRYLVSSTTSTSETVPKISEDFGSANVFLNAGTTPISANLSEFLERVKSDTARDALKKFASIRCDKLWSQDKRVKGNANDFFESGFVKPDTVLRDYVRMLHPDLAIVKEHETVFMRRVERGDDSEQLKDIGTCPYAEFDRTPSKGMAYVDKVFRVSELDVFEVQDGIERDVVPLLSENDIPSDSVEMWFSEVAEADATETKLSVRRRVALGDAETFEENSGLSEILGEGLGVSVSETSSAIIRGEAAGDEGDGGAGDGNGGGDGNETPNDDEKGGGGLSGGAVAAIVICVLLAVLAGYMYVRWRRRRGGMHDSLGGEGLDGGDFGGGGDGQLQESVL